MDEETIISKILDAAFDLHREYGPGLLESVYEALLYEELKWKGLEVQRQVSIPLFSRGVSIEKAFIADLIIERKILIELKACEKIEKVHYKQVLTYLRLSNLRLGLLINFNQALLKDGLKRIVN